MEIIKKGKLPEERTYTITCDECETVFKFQRKEARYTSDQRDGNYLTIDCPVCKDTCHINVSGRD